MSFSRKLSDKYEKEILGTATKTGLDVVKPASKKVVHKTAEVARELIGNKIAKKTVKPQSMFNINLENVDEKGISSKKRQELLNNLR